MATWSYVLFALLGGAMLPTQLGINGQLAEWVSGSVRAACASFLAGAGAVLVAVLATARGSCRTAP